MRRSASGFVLPLALALVVLAAREARAFPGSVRWGYGNCVTCHYNVAGGGVLTPYGRQLSRELLSTWGGEKEAEFAYGTPTPSWLGLGGDISYAMTPEHAMKLVQADLEAAAHGGRLLAVASVGRDDDGGDAMGHGWMSRRHYLQVDATRALSVRAGRFLPNYGVWNGDASTATRAGLGWDRDTYNVEANWVSERWNAAATAIVAGADAGPVERGVSASAGVFFGGKRKIWLSALSRGQPGLSRRAAGVSSVVGIGSHAYLLVQGDLQHLRSQAGSHRDFYGNACFARETVKGLYVLLLDEVAWRETDDAARTSHSYGAALRWFPRPHWELQLRWREQDREAVSPRDMDGVSLFLHFYP